MNENEIRARAEEEQNRIVDLLSEVGVSDKRLKLLAPVILNTSWMKAKLDDAREAIKNSNIVISYDNGGNQRGIRINPLFTGYEALWKSYMAGMNKILDCLPAEQIEIETQVVESPKTMLELVRNKHIKDA
jgi:hypothetical protein